MSFFFFFNSSNLTGHQHSTRFLKRHLLLALAAILKGLMRMSFPEAASEQTWALATLLPPGSVRSQWLGSIGVRTIQPIPVQLGRLLN